jgi:hypothetical protein
MAEDLIRYDILAQDALRGVVRKVLSEVSRTGLPGEHHFFIKFATKAPGVRISSRLLKDYPDEITIVLQHQYRDLTVTEHAFEVVLSFNGVSERLLVPFTALRGFFDPSVQFGLQFEQVARPDVTAAAEAGEAVDEKPPAIAAGPAAKEGKPDSEEDKEAGESRAAEVVSLDAFRKK